MAQEELSKERQEQQKEEQAQAQAKVEEAAAFDAAVAGEEPPPPAPEVPIAPPPPPPDEWANVPKVVKDELAALRKMPEQIRHLAGHIGGMKSQIEQYVAVARQTAKTGADAPTRQQITAATGSSKKWKELHEMYPEWSEGTAEYVHEYVDSRVAQLKEQTPSVDPEAIRKQVTEQVTGELTASFATRLEEATETAYAMAVVENKHPGWRKRVKTEEFKQWRVKQAPELQALAESYDPDDAITMLDHFETDRVAAARVARNKERLTGAIPATSGTQAGRLREPETEMDGYLDAFRE